MATRISKLLKRDVVAILEGRTLGRPANVLIDPDQQRIAAVVLVAAQIPELSVAVRSSAILSFGTDTIAIEAMSSLRVAAHDELVLGLLAHGGNVRGREVLSGAGEKLGRIRDVVVDDAGDVTEYRIRKHRLGLFRPLLKVSPDVLRAPTGQVAVVDSAALEAPTPVPEAPVPTGNAPVVPTQAENEQVALATTGEHPGPRSTEAAPPAVAERDPDS